MRPWLGYLRVSRVGDRKDTLISPELQRDQIASYAAPRGLEVEYLDNELDVSGGKRSRPILDVAIARVESGECEGVIVDTLDRLSRLDLVDALKTIHRIEDAGGQVIGVAENFDPTTPDGRMVRNFFLSIGEWQRQRYGGKIAASKTRAVEHGIWPMSVVPIGYRMAKRAGAKNGPLERDPETAHLVVRAFELRAGGASWRQVGEVLGRGASGAAKVISNRVYLGEIRLRVGGEEIVNPTAHEPLVDRALWESAQLEHPRPARSGAVGPALLAGIIRCAGCRGLLSPAVSDRWSGYRCVAGRQRADGRCAAPAIVAKSLIDPYVEAAVLDALDVSYAAGERVDAVEGAQRELLEAEAELAAFAQAVDASSVGAEHVADALRSRAARVDVARRELAEARLRSAPIVPGGDVRAAWPEFSVEDRRHVLRGALSVVWIRKGRGPIAERARVVAAGFGPADLPRPGGGRFAVEPAPWPDRDLPGEIRPTSA